MMKTIYLLLLLVLGVTGLWDGFTTFYGTSQILGNDILSLIIAVIFSIIITAFLFSTNFIWDINRENSFIIVMLRGFWFVSFLYDMFTSFIGNKDLLIKDIGTFSQISILVGITILVSGSPIIFSYILHLRYEEDE